MIVTVGQKILALTPYCFVSPSKFNIEFGIWGQLGYLNFRGVHILYVHSRKLTRSPKRGPFQKESSLPTNKCASTDMLVFVEVITPSLNITAGNFLVFFGRT